MKNDEKEERNTYAGKKIHIFKSPVNIFGLSRPKCLKIEHFLVIDLLDGPVSKHGAIVLEGNRHRLRESKLNKRKPM